MKRWAVLAIVFLAGCGKNPEPPASPTTPAVSSAPTATATAPETAPESVPHKARKPFEVYSACADVVTVSFAEDAKAPTAGRKTLAPSGTIEGPRNEDGSQTVWLLDDKGEPIAKVNVTRGMKRVEIGRSCRTLDAR
jgi:hypothetical protein